MKLFGTYLQDDFQFPVLEEPRWSHQVDRWYQLDAYAYALAEFYSRWVQKFSIRPDLMILASSEGSNRTDFQFVKSNGMSPSRFVHTLPNIRSSSLLKLMNWNGPLLCLQNDPKTQVSALREAFDLLGGKWSRIWIFGISLYSTKCIENTNYKVHWYDLQKTKQINQGHFLSFEILKQEFFAAGNSNPSTLESLTDKTLLEWFAQDRVSTYSFGEYLINRIDFATSS